MSTPKNIFSHWPPVNKQEWLEQIRKDLKGADFNDALVSAYSNIAVQPIYTKEDIPESEQFGDDDFEEIMEFEDEGQAITWSVCRELNFNAESDIYTLGDAEINNGAMCIRISGDVPLFLKQFRMVRPEANHFTLSINNDLSESEIVSNYRDLINNISGHQLYLTAIEFDPISYWMKTGTMQDKVASFNHLADLYFKLSPKLHDCKLFHVDTSITTEAGADIVQQLAYSLAIAVEYISALSKRNIPVEEIFQLMHFRMSIGSEYFFEIAKLQAFQRLWINLLTAYIPDTDYMAPAYIHAVVTQTNITAEDAHTNLLRTTTEAMSAILGGCEVLSILPYDLHRKTKDENAERLALNIQHLLRYESYLDQYRNMADGAYYIESLTTTIAEDAWNYFVQIQNSGGFIANLESGKIQQAIRNSREKIQDAFASEKIKLVGVNVFEINNETIEAAEEVISKNTNTSFEPITPFHFKKK
ncbi:MAG TPA: methylmalonyl-CoA mutase family protein [Chitinophagales bacterium]|nr:methylmalonyl-CoA mutase family protein [Chitinophagales bacterium]